MQLEKCFSEESFLQSHESKNIYPRVHVLLYMLSSARLTRFPRSEITRQNRAPRISIYPISIYPISIYPNFHLPQFLIHFPNFHVPYSLLPSTQVEVNMLK